MASSTRTVVVVEGATSVRTAELAVVSVEVRTAVVLAERPVVSTAADFEEQATAVASTAADTIVSPRTEWLSWSRVGSSGIFLGGV